MLSFGFPPQGIQPWLLEPSLGQSLRQLLLLAWEKRLELFKKDKVLAAMKTAVKLNRQEGTEASWMCNVLISVP